MPGSCIIDASEVDPIAGDWCEIDSRGNSTMMSSWTERLCVRPSADALDMAICINEGLGEAPRPRFEDRGDDGADSRELDDQTVPAFFEGAPVNNIEDGIFCGPLIEQDLLTDVQRERETLAEALGTLGWGSTEGLVERIMASADRRPRSSVLPCELQAAYLATDYVAELPGKTLALRVGDRSAGLSDLYASESNCTASFVTAWNPLGEALTSDANAARHQALLADVADLKLRYFDGEGRGADGNWPPEKSVLMLGLTFEQAIHLGRHHQQNAIVWAAPDATPKLTLLR